MKRARPQLPHTAQPPRRPCAHRPRVQRSRGRDEPGATRAGRVARTLLVLAAATAATAVGTAAGTARAQGIQTNVALPVARGEGIFRSQLRYRRAHDDPSGSGRELDALVAPQTLGYCVTPRFTAFATLPVLAYRRLQAPGGKVQRDSAPGDLRLLGRATLWADDYAPLSTRRFALLGGLELPTGDDGFGWLQSPVLNETTRLVMVADPGRGRLTARGYEAGVPVTRPLRLVEPLPGNGAAPPGAKAGENR